MSMLDKIVDKVTSAEPGAGGLPAQLLALLQSPEFGGIQGLVQKFDRAGLGATVKSWIGDATPRPITPAEITRVLGSDAIASFASKAGLSTNQVGQQLTTILPEIVKRLTPGGQTASLDSIAALGAKLGEKVGI